MQLMPQDKKLAVSNVKNEKMYICVALSPRFARETRSNGRALARPCWAAGLKLPPLIARRRWSPGPRARWSCTRGACFKCRAIANSKMICV